MAAEIVFDKLGERRSPTWEWAAAPHGGEDIARVYGARGRRTGFDLPSSFTVNGEPDAIRLEYDAHRRGRGLDGPLEATVGDVGTQVSVDTYP